MSGFFPDANFRNAVGGDIVEITGTFTIEDNTLDKFRNKTVYYTGNTDITITNNSNLWTDGDTFSIINDGTQIALITFISADPALGPFVTDILFPGEAVVLKLAGTVWREIARKATPDRIIIQSLANVETTADIDTDPQTKFDETHTLKGGEYELTLSFEGMAQATNRALAVEFFIDDVIVQQRFSSTVNDVRDILWLTRFGKTPVLTQGDHDFRLMFGRDYGGGGNPVSIAGVSLKIESVR